MEKKAVIRTTFLKIISYILMFVGLLLMYFLGPKLIWATIPLILGIIGFAYSGEAYIDDYEFEVKILIGTFHISWSEVNYIETGSGNMIIGSDNKRIAFPSFEYWNGKEKEKAIEILLKVMEERNIEIEETARAILPIYKGTRKKIG